MIAALTSIFSLVLAGCAEGEENSVTQIDSPRGALKTECTAPLVFSKRYGLIAFGCDDGSISIAQFERPAKSIPNAFVLDVSSIEDTDGSLSAQAFRPAGPEGEPASLVSIDLLAGTSAVERIEGAQDVDSIVVNAAGDCLLAARSDSVRHDDYLITAHDMRGRRGVSDAIGHAPDIQVAVTGNEASGIGSPSYAFSRCLVGPNGTPELLLTRIRPVDGGAEFTLELHRANATPLRLYQTRSQLSISSRQAGYRLALIEDGTGRLGLLDLSGVDPVLTWVAFDGHWLHYDPSDGSGVVLRDPGLPGGQGGADSRGALVSVRCDPAAPKPVCRDDVMVSSSATEAHADGAGGAGAGVIVRYTEVVVSPGSTAYWPRWRWIF